MEKIDFTFFRKYNENARKELTEPPFWG